MTTTHTTVVATNTAQQWQTGLCDCCADGCCGFLYALHFAPCAAASARTAFDNSNFCLNVCCVAHPVLHYNIVREGYHIQGNCCEDLCITSFCTPCAIVRMKGEIQKRGKPINTIVTATTTVAPVPIAMTHAQPQSYPAQPYPQQYGQPQPQPLLQSQPQPYVPPPQPQPQSMSMETSSSQAPLYPNANN